ncbi:MAG: hypothetical protein JXR03_12470 [Cyclobacteriaceae bacterium]
MKTQEETYGLSRRLGKAPRFSFLSPLWVRPLLIGVLFTISTFLYAQSPTCQTFQVDSIIHLGELPVAEASITVTPSLPFTFDAIANSIKIDKQRKLDSVKVCFQTISPDLLGPYFNRNIKHYSRGRVSQISGPTLPSAIPKEEIFAFNDLESYGAITRGVSFGNRQNLFVNSALNLQLDGQLSEDLYVSASITDQNVPYQPEGNTQQIRDFDNVFIKLYNEKFNLIAGDVALTNPVKEGYFLKYYKNVQGLSLDYTYKLNEKWKARSSLGGSAAKGQFSSAQLDPIEGVQGPYRLVGPNGERFIIVLADSERVFIDGQLLQRGFDRDYVIDYNLGEITFSNTILITRFTRIRVDFEYAEQNYSRTNLNATQEIWNDKLKFYFNFYQEKDNSNSTLGFEISDNDRDALAQLGDNNGLGVVSGADSVGFIENAVLYRKADTISNNIAYSIFTYETNPQDANYRVVFSEVGFGNGDYVLQSSSANGRIYEWIAPLNGESQGNYAPIRIIPLPNKKQMIVLGNQVKINRFETIGQELAISNQDQNLYSEIGDANNSGLAWKANFDSKGRIFGAYKVDGGVSFEWVDETFKWIDRFRPIEYDRNWGYNIFQDTLDRSDRILRSNVSIKKGRFDQLSYKFSYRDRAGIINGQQHDAKLSKSVGPILSKTSLYKMSNSPSGLASEWLRFKEDISIKTPLITPGYIFELDQQRTKVADTLVSSFMYFQLHDFYIQSGDSSHFQFRADYIRREDKIPVDGMMIPFTKADEFRLRLNGTFWSSQAIGVSANYREVKDRIGATSDENILGKVDWNGTFLNKHVRQNFSYSTANTRELRREFIFITVPTGEGTHTWRDENEDGLQDLNEFYEAINIDERNYIKIFTPTDEYISAFQSTWQHGLDVKLPKRWRSEGGIVGELSKLSFNTNVQLNYKSTDNNLANRLTPFRQRLKDVAVISAQNRKRYSVFYNRNGSGLAFDFNRNANERKSLLTNGFEIRKRQNWSSNVRWSLEKGLMVRFQGELENVSNESDFLESRNFEIDGYSWAPELVWQPTNGFRVSGKFQSEESAKYRNRAKLIHYQLQFGIDSHKVRKGKSKCSGSMDSNRF